MEHTDTERLDWLVVHIDDDGLGRLFVERPGRGMRRWFWENDGTNLLFRTPRAAIDWAMGRK